MKILIIGHARHGKDTLAELWRDEFGMTFCSSSMKAAEIFIFDELKGKYGYSNFEECFNDRVNHRAEWHDLICEYNKNTPSRLAREIIKDSDCYVGMRSKLEIMSCQVQSMFDLVVWVDASKRLPLEGSNSLDISSIFADVVLENNLGLHEFKRKANILGKLIFKK